MKRVHPFRGLQLGFGISIAMLIALSVVSYRSVVAATAGASWLRHTHQVIESLAGLLSATQDLDAGYRGFALVGDERFLKTYDDGRTKLPAALAAIAALTADNAGEQYRIVTLTTLVDRKIQFADEVVRLRGEAGAQGASERVASGDGIRLSEDIRSLILEIGNQEERLLVTRQAVADRDFKQITLVLALGVVSLILMLGVAGWKVSRDTRARWESDEALRGSEERLRHERDRAQRYLDTAQVILLALDTDGRITAANRYACTVLGWTEDELLGRDWFDTCLVPRLRTAVRERLRILLRGSLSLAENTILTRSGDERLIEWRSTVLRDSSGTVTGTFSSGTDITERHQAVEALRTAKDGAEAANQAKGEFLANMSHEIRTPMNGIIGMTDLVLDTELTPEQRENLRIVKSSADALLTVINDILDFSRMEAGKFELDPIDFNARDAIGDTANAVALKAHQQGLELIVDIAAEVPETLRGDVGRLRQILVNLLGNAIKFTRHGEVVLRVTTEAVTPDDVVLHFSVRDTGVGIPLERQASVFDAFTQADGSVTRQYGGTGLGLTICSQLVQLMGGRLWLNSEAGSGSTFHFTATFVPVQGSALVAAVPDEVDLRDRSVLVVDDNATNRRLLHEILTGWHMVPTLVEFAADALAALRGAQASAAPFHLVLTDVQMPDTDGFTLAQSIKSDPAIVGATVVMLTSAGQPGDAARCRELGIAAYLSKPIKASELRHAILLALAGHPKTHDRPALVTRHTVREARYAGRVLLVEDNQVNQLVARRLLEKRGYTVVVASNGREALQTLEDAAIAFGCVLMDVQMPEMGGFECTALIRDKELLTGLHLPIVAMTAHAMKGDAARCLAAGMDGYLSKPIQADDLFDVVERHLRI